MSGINSVVLNNYVERNFPTLNAALEGERWQKVAFVFLSVVTCGIAPLFLILYDLGKNLIHRVCKRDLSDLRNAVILKDPRNPVFKINKTRALIGLAGAAFLLNTQFKIDLLAPITNGFFRNSISFIRNFQTEITIVGIALAGVYLIKGALEQYEEENKLNINPFKSSQTTRGEPQSPAQTPSAPPEGKISNVYPDLSSLNPNPEGMPSSTSSTPSAPPASNAVGYGSMYPDLHRRA